MKTEFKELKNEFLEKVKPFDPCKEELNRVIASENESELLKVIYDNINWCTERKVISHEYFSKFTPEIYLQSGIGNLGKENTGFMNSGNWNSGDRNSGDSNSGDCNSGDCNSGHRNSGDRNSGYSNSGDCNSGYRNSGDRNSGDSNSGDCNSGHRNSGYSNSGYSNSGNSNSGNWNSGDRNSGDRNSGDRNSGYWNSGDRNSGDCNSGYRNSGGFCTISDPIMWLFNKPCKKMTVKQWEQTNAYKLMYSIDNTILVQWSAMTEEEKKSNPKYEASEGYTKSIPLKEAWANAWYNWSDENKKEFTSLENFDAKIFEEITGIKV